jgi:prepilin-type N-terminal cleavage/methylation domain-containing protein
LGERRRDGFTLVEVIVVLVILAILAAIAIPALTGYIEKAQGKKYIADARNLMVATKTVLDEAYANGDFASGAAAEYFLNGDETISSSVGFKVFLITSLSELATGDPYTYSEKIGELSGMPFLLYTLDSSTVYSHEIFPSAPEDSDATALTSSGFMVGFIPDGYEVGKPAVFVTYKIDRVEGLATYSDIQTSLISGDFTYKDNAGYEVYQITID